MLFYSDKDKGLYNDPMIIEKGWYSVAIGKLELVFEFETNILWTVNGYFPLDTNNIINEKIDLPDFQLSKYIIKSDFIVEELMTYDFSNYSNAFINNFVDNANDLIRKNCIHDKYNRLIKWGIDDKEYDHLKVNENIILSIYNNKISCIYIHYDKRIK